tara:strand:- start:353 stop:2623 length:2271 start_codon:yes stop_codon:yes gene_type:complete
MTTPAAPDTVNSVGATDDASKGGLFNSLNNTTLSTIEQAIATKATNAATSATNAKTSETNAATSATNAATSATNAATSETNAGNSATAAATSATNAANTLDAFDDRYLGNKTSDPSVDNDGNALLTGALYFNTTDNIMRVYTGSSWVTVKPTSSDQTAINAVNANATNINAVNSNSSNINAVAGNATNINAVNSNSSNINAVAGNATNINTVAGDTTEINTVAGIAGNITTVANNDSNVTTVANNNTNITTVAGISSNVTSVANNSSNINTVAAIFEGTATYTVTVQGGVFYINTGSGATSKPALTLVKGFTYTFDVSDNTNSGHPLAFKDSGGNAYTTGVTVTGTAGQAGAKVVFAVPTTGTQPARYYCTQHGNNMGNTITTENNDIAEVLTISSEITTVAGISSNVTTVAGISANVTTVAGISANVTTVAGISANVTTVAGIHANVTTVAGDTTEINAVAGNATNINTVAGISSDVTTVAGIQANVTTVASNNSNVTSVANNASNINTVAGAITNVNTVASNISHVSTVSGAISNVNTVATNIANVNAFANTYFIGSSAPSGGTIGSGDLWYDTNTSQMKVYNGSAWVTFISTYDTDDLSEGSSNLYYTDTRADARITNAFGNDVTLGGNLTFSSGEIRGPSTLVIDPAVVGANSGLVQIKGSLQVDGTTTTVNSQTLDVTDKNITIANGSANAAAANGGGLTIDCGSDPDATFTYANTDDSLSVNKTFKAPAVKINGADAASQGFAVAMAIAL